MPSPLPPHVQMLIEELRKLPGVGEKTATRYTLYLLKKAVALQSLSTCLQDVANKIRPCSLCGFIAEDDICVICGDQTRDSSMVCVVEDIQDCLAIERVGEYRGLYHILGGVISPLRGITPEKLNIESLFSRVKKGDIKEIIVATSANAEGETTALYLKRVLSDLGVRITRPVIGIPMGSSIEYLDGITLMRALHGRREL